MTTRRHLTTRRQWLEDTALAAAIVGLPTGLRAQLAKPDASRPDYLALALRAARWIESSRQVTGVRTAWPADPLKPESVHLDLYNGMPGVVLFMTELGRVTGDSQWLARAEAGAEHLWFASQDLDPMAAGLYSGLAGLAFTFMVMADTTGNRRDERRARAMVERLHRQAQISPDGAIWGDSYDIIGGNAGIGLLLLEAHRRWGDRPTLQLAASAGRRLLAGARVAERGRMWYPGPTSQRNYPNFSHGTAGVGYFLATLFERTGDQSFLDGAIAAAHYLESIATHTADGKLIFHHEPGGEGLFYLSWCHGPAGTSRFFTQLHRQTGDHQWAVWVDALTRGLFGTGVPERRTPGFWQNISQCCGNVGVGEFMLDLATTAPTKASRSLLDRVVTDTMHRSSTGADDGLRWVQAEHRVQPDNVVAQTGYMQGAAGVGCFLLRLHALERGTSRHLQWPDSPFRQAG